MTLPLGLRLEHDATRMGFLGAHDVRLGADGGVALERLRLALPGAWTLHTATADRLSSERTALAELVATLGEGMLNARLAALIERRPPLPGVRGVELRLQPGHASLLIWRELPPRPRAARRGEPSHRQARPEVGDDSPQRAAWRSVLTTCRVFVAPPAAGEPADCLVLELYEPRSYGPPGDQPPALVVRDVLEALFDCPELVGRVDDPLERADPAGAAYGPTLERDRIRLRPLKRLLAELLAPLGWKLPALGEGLVCHYALEDGCLRLDCRDLELAGPTPHAPERLAQPAEARREHAELDQARRVLRNADAALFAGQLDHALDLLRALHRRLGHHPALLARLGYGLLARADVPGHLDELAALCAEALKREPGLVVARLLHALELGARHDAPAAAAHAMRELLGYLDAGQQPLDRVCALLAVARLEATLEPARAVAALREAIRLEPGLRAPLEALDELYESLGEHAQRLDILHRLLGLCRDRARRSRLELRLAGALHAAGATEHADEALRRAAALCAPDDLEDLEALADAAATLADPTVAIGLFTRLADLAESHHDAPRAARAYLGCARLWLTLGSPVNARLAGHAALAADPALLPAAELLVHTSLDSGDPRSAIATLEDLVLRLERERWTSPGDDALEHVLADATAMLARLADDDDQPQLARLAWRRRLRYVPDDDEAYAALCAIEPPHERVDAMASRAEALRARGALQPACDLMVELATLYEHALRLPADALGWLERAIALSPSAELEERRLALYEATGRHFELRAALAAQVERVVEPRRRVELLLRLGRLELDALHDPAAAAATLERAAALVPAAREPLLELRRAQRSAGRHADLVTTLERLAQLTPEPRARRAFLVEAGDALHERLHNPRQAVRFYREALALGDPDPLLEQRIQLALHTARAASAPASPAAVPPWSAPPTDVAPALAELPLLPLTASVTPTPAPSSPTAVDPLPTPVSEELELAMLHGAEALDLLSSDAGTSADFELPEAAPGSRHISALDEVFAPPSAPPERPLAEPLSSHGTRDQAPPAAPAPDSSADALPAVELPAERPVPARPFTVPDPREAPDWRTAAQAWTRAGATSAPPPPSPAPQPASAPPSPAPPAEAAPPTHSSDPPTSDTLAAARRSGDPQALVALLERSLLATTEPLARARLHQEIGCLAYYELDDAERACDHLELASEADPDGVALEGETLTALEGIYEDLDDPAHLAEVYARRLRRLERPEMEPVYRMLAAHLYRERLGNAQAARAQLAAVLEQEPEHEPALRLLAELEREAGRPAEAAALLGRLVALHEAPAAEDDGAAVAALLLEQADQLEAAGRIDEARRALLRAVRVSPTPHIALERLKRLCRVHDDWQGLVNALVREISLQLPGDDGSARALGLEDLFELAPQSVPVALRVSICQTLREIADILSLKLEADLHAWKLYGRVLALSPDDAYALERRIELGRALERWSELSSELVQLAPMLLDPALQAEALAEAAALARDRLDDRLRARELLQRATTLLEARPERHAQRLAELRQSLERLDRAVVVHVSLGSGTQPRIPAPPPAAPRAAARRTPAAGSVPASADPEALEDLFDVERQRADLEALERELEGESERGRRVELLTRKGTLLSRQPETQHEALVALRAALALEPGHAPARLALVDGLLATGEVEQALNHLIVVAQGKEATAQSELRTELVKLVEVILATGRPGVVPRARALLNALRTP